MKAKDKTIGLISRALDSHQKKKEIDTENQNKPYLLKFNHLHINQHKITYAERNHKDSLILMYDCLSNLGDMKEKKIAPISESDALTLENYSKKYESMRILAQDIFADINNKHSIFERNTRALLGTPKKEEVREKAMGFANTTLEFFAKNKFEDEPLNRARETFSRKISESKSTLESTISKSI